MLTISADGKTATVAPVVAAPPARLAGALAQFIHEAMFAARDADDALLQDLESVAALGNGKLEVVLAGQRLEVQVRAATPGFYGAQS
jgi:hypothetical protein